MRTRHSSGRADMPNEISSPDLLSNSRIDIQRMFLVADTIIYACVEEIVRAAIKRTPCSEAIKNAWLLAFRYIHRQIEHALPKLRSSDRLNQLCHLILF